VDAHFSFSDRAPPKERSSVRFALLVTLLALLTLATIALGDGQLDATLAPALILVAGFVIWHAPLRYPALALVFLALTLENPSDAPACGIWKSPLYNYGALFLAHMNVTFPECKALVFSGLDVALIYMFIVAAYRRVTHSRIDPVDIGPSPRPMRLFTLACVAGAFWMWTFGMARGDSDFASSLWQVQRVVYLPIVFFLFDRAFNRPGDYVALGKVVVAAACVRAVLAIYLRVILPAPPGEEMLWYATTHADSMLFADATCIVVALVFEQFDKKRLTLAVLLLPLLIAGAKANTRRIVWVEIACSLLVLFLATRWSRLKRRVARAAIFAMPALITYVAVGWDAGGGFFHPARVVRSIIDSKADGSTEWRDWENFNLFYTVRHAPLFGTGYGHGYVEFVHLPDISRSYSLYRYIPHNSVLGLWAYGGLVGFTLLWAMLVVGIFFAVRVYRFATKPEERTAALAALSVIVVYLVHCYGDMGLGTWTAVFTVAPALVVVGKLAITTGAWPSRASARDPVPSCVRASVKPMRAWVPAAASAAGSSGPPPSPG
jgi:O-antigen ligase